MVSGAPITVKGVNGTVSFNGDFVTISRTASAEEPDVLPGSLRNPRSIRSTSQMDMGASLAHSGQGQTQDDPAGELEWPAQVQTRVNAGERLLTFQLERSGQRSRVRARR